MKHQLESLVTDTCVVNVSSELTNRVVFRDRLERAISYATRYNHILAVLYVNLDDFRSVNDSVGRRYGDQLLDLVANRLRHCVRRSDSGGYLDGDEFGFIVHNLKRPADAMRIAKNLARVLLKPFRLDDVEYVVSASIGIAVFPGDGDDCDALLRHAETAMYVVKRQGKNGCEFYTKRMSERARDLLDLENDLRRAISRDELALYYQPILDTATRSIVGCEALLRWAHPERGLISPMVFVPIAEESGLIFEIGDWVLKSACRQAKRWQKLGYPKITVAVNVSARQFERIGLGEQIINALVATNLDPEYLHIELTEAVFVSNPDRVIETLEQLRALGVSVSIDDFGTGYSSLGQLQRLPIDILKIDRSFLQAVPLEEENTIIVDMIVNLGRRLGLTIIAEGVEKDAQLAYLQKIQCHRFQGFLISKPLPVVEFETLLAESIPV